MCSAGWPQGAARPCRALAEARGFFLTTGGDRSSRCLHSAEGGLRLWEVGARHVGERVALGGDSSDLKSDSARGQLRPLQTSPLGT